MLGLGLIPFHLALLSAQDAAREPSPQETPSETATTAEPEVGPEEVVEPDVTLDLPVSIDGDYVRDLTVGIAGMSMALLRPSDLLSVLEGRVTDEFAAGLDLSGREGLVSGDDLARRGLVVTFDSATLTVEIDVPAAARLPKALSIAGRSVRAPSEDDLPPAEFAAGLNLVFEPSVVHAGGETGLAPISLRGQGFVSVGGFDGVKLAYEGRYAEGARNPFAVGDVVLFHDRFQHAVRYAAGTITPPVTARFANAPGIVGIGVFRDYIGIRPFENLRPNGATRFVLDEAALVTIDVNGAPVLSERFEAGSYDLKDLPLTLGANDVRVLVENDGGVRELAILSPYLDNELLARGKSRFALVGGGLREVGGVLPGIGDPAGIAFYERGVRDWLTLGGAAEAIGDGRQVSGRVVVGTALGLIGAEGAFQRQPNGDEAVGGTLQYTLQTDPTQNVNHRVDVRLGMRQEGFGPLRSTAIFGPDLRRRDETLEASVRYSANIGRVGTFAAGQWQSVGQRETASGTLGVAFRLARLNCNVRARASFTSDPLIGEVDEQSVLFSVSSRLPGAGRVRASYDTDNRQAVLRYQKIGGVNVGDWDARAVFTDDLSSESADLAANLVTNRARIGLSHRSSRTDGRERSVTAARLEVGFGTAGGKVAFGRPFRDGFAIVSAHPTLEEREVELRRQDGSLDAKTGFFGPALQPLRRAYRAEVIDVVVDDLPVGYDVGMQRLSMFPSELSGYAHTVGKDASNTVLGSLLRPDGEPMALAVGTIQAQDAPPGTEGVSFFTNRTGRFVAEGLGSGTYELRLKPDDRLVATIEIPEAADGLVRVGDVTMEVP